MKILEKGERVMIYPKDQVSGTTIAAEVGSILEFHQSSGEYLVKVDGRVWPWLVSAAQVRAINE